MADKAQEDKKASPLVGMPMPGATSSAPQAQGAGTTIVPPLGTPGTGAPATPAGQVPQEQEGTYTDYDTGKSTNVEPGLEEGDLYLDYVAPIRGLFTGGLVAAGKMAANYLGKKGVDSMKDKMPPPGATPGGGLDYSKMPGAPGTGAQSGYTTSYQMGGARGQQGPGTTTQATTGFGSRPGIKALDQDEIDLAPLGGK